MPHDDRNSGVSRRMAIAGLALSPAAAAASQNEQGEEEVRAALLKFLAAFENSDLPAMEQAFAEDAVTFAGMVMKRSGSPPFNLDDLRRKPGMSASMRRNALERPKRDPGGPPYISLKPLDLMIQVGADMAVCTFHLEVSSTQLGRRTIVMAKRGGAWKIIHLHPSNADTA